MRSSASPASRTFRPVSSERPGLGMWLLVLGVFFLTMSFSGFVLLAAVLAALGLVVAGVWHSQRFDREVMASQVSTPLADEPLLSPEHFALQSLGEYEAKLAGILGASVPGSEIHVSAAQQLDRLRHIAHTLRTRQGGDALRQVRETEFYLDQLEKA